MIQDFHTDKLGDCKIDQFQINFQSQTTRLLLRAPLDREEAHHYHLEFKAVIWQEFNAFSTDNILWGMEVADSLDDFKERQSEYLHKMQNHFPPDLLNRLEQDNTLQYYFLIPSCGVDGFIICKSAEIVALH